MIICKHYKWNENMLYLPIYKELTISVEDFHNNKDYGKYNFRKFWKHSLDCIKWAIIVFITMECLWILMIEWAESLHCEDKDSFIMNNSIKIETASWNRQLK